MATASKDRARLRGAAGRGSPRWNHDVFACLHAVAHEFASVASLDAEPDVVQVYLAEVDALWTGDGLEFGRGNRPIDHSYHSPFHEFAERILLAQRDPQSRLFQPLSKEEETATKIALWKIARTTGENPKLPSERWLISDRTLRTDRKSVV